MKLLLSTALLAGFSCAGLAATPQAPGTAKAAAAATPSPARMLHSAQQQIDAASLSLIHI